jgi:hypothetical protein
MAFASKKKSAGSEISTTIVQLQKEIIHARLLGRKPLMMNRLPEKARHELLWPARKRNQAELAVSIKHDPLDEYRRSVYRCRDESAPTVVHLPDNAIKKAMATAALDIPGATKAQIGRLVTIESPTVYIYGEPLLHMGIVRQAGPSRTPDVRTRAYFPQWACQVEIGFIKTVITADDVLNLLGAAGMIVGIGDGRQEKGTFSYGMWEVVGEDNEEWNDIVKNQGRDVQAAALNQPSFADEDTEEMYSWYQSEIIRRDVAGSVHTSARKAKRKNGQPPEEEAVQ